MAKQTVNLGTSANKGDGDPLRTAFDKVNDNFTEVYSLLGAEGGDVDDVVAPMLVHSDHTNVTVTRDDAANKIIFSVDPYDGDITGSVFGDDSTVLVDGVNSKIVGPIESTSILPGDGTTDIGSTSNRFYNAWFTGQVETDSVLANIFYGPLTGNVTGDVSGTAGAVAFSGITGKPTTLAGYGITDAMVSGAAYDGDITGSVFGDDSTLLVDGVNNKVMLTTNTTTELTEGTNLYYTDVRADARITNAGSANWDTAFAWGNHASAGYQVAGAPHDGDIEGSVFGDDSTLLVDAVNNKIVGPVETSSLRTSETSIALGNEAGSTSQGANAIAIGEKAGYANQAANSIVINATGAEVYNFGASSLMITPIRSAAMTTILGYDADTGEVTHNAAIPGYTNTADLKALVAASTDFDDFQARIAAL